MIKKVSLFLVLFTLSNFLIAQDYILNGVITDRESGEPLIGANILVGEKGVISDFEGKYEIKLADGKYQVVFSYVGYESQTFEVNIEGANQKLDVNLGTGVFLDYVTVVADVAKERETPVAFSNIPTQKIEEELAGQDLPMLLNSTPGAYATQSGGGDGDARITIRGFNQRNVAVMLDGIPVNDMENGWVYWSNWFGLDVVTKTVQVQRGLGASKLAIPSVGGTINILTKGIESKFGVKFQQEFGNDGYLRSTLGVTSGRLKNGWGISAAGSYKQGDGWVDQNYTKGYFYYLRIDKEFGKHLISFSGFGAPQYHGQRSFKSSIATFDVDFAKKQGINFPEDIPDTTNIDKGLRYNQHWGTVNSDSINSGASLGFDSKTINTRKNYFHKPQFSLRYSYAGSSKFYLSTVLYLSIGNGGGTGTDGSVDLNDEGQQDLNKVYEANTFTFPPAITVPRSQGILRSSVNNHVWYGLLSTARYNINDKLTLSGGIDLRDYRGEHYREVYDLLGGDYYKSERNARVNEDGTIQNHTRLKVGDKYYYYNEGFVRWGGLFGLLEYKNEKLTIFGNLSSAATGYKAVDYMFHKQLDINGQSYFISYAEPLELDDVLYTVDNPSQESIDYATDNGLTLDTESAQNQMVDWVWIPSFTFKAGASYNIDEKNSVFVNTGYLSRATRFNNVIDFPYDSGEGFGRIVKFENYKNEEILAFELGYSYKSSIFSTNVNAYLTKWNNKPLEFAPTVLEDPSDPESDRIPVNINGLAALHYGIELDFAIKPFKSLIIEGLASVADWTWDSAAETTLEDGSVYTFDAKGVHVGDAAQYQFGGLIRYEPIKGLYFKVKTTYFAKNFSNFDPESLKGNNAGRESWQMPNYNIVDAYAGYTFKIQKIGLGVRLNVLNILDTHFITDAQNNDRFIQSFNEYDAKSASVFFGQGRRWTVSLQFSY